MTNCFFDGWKTETSGSALAAEPSTGLEPTTCDYEIPHIISRATQEIRTLDLLFTKSRIISRAIYGTRTHDLLFTKQLLCQLS